MNTSSSVFDRMIGHSRPIWVTLLASTLLLALPFAAALMDGTLGELFQTDQWRVLLLPPVIIVYIMLVSPLMTRMGEQVLEALRPLVPLDDDAFDNIVRKAAQINPVHELLVFGAGFALGILSATASSADAGFSWLGAYWFLAMGLMYGILAWTVYVSVISTRVNASHPPQAAAVRHPGPRAFRGSRQAKPAAGAGVRGRDHTQPAALLPDREHDHSGFLADQPAAGAVGGADLLHEHVPHAPGAGGSETW